MTDNDPSGAAQSSQGISDTQMMMLHNDAIGLRDCDGYAPGAQTGRDILAIIARLRTAEARCAVFRRTIVDAIVELGGGASDQASDQFLGGLPHECVAVMKALRAAEAERDARVPVGTYHENIAQRRIAEQAMQERDALRDDVAAIFAQTEPPFDGATKAQHVIRFIGNLRDDVARLTAENEKVHEMHGAAMSERDRAICERDEVRKEMDISDHVARERWKARCVAEAERDQALRERDEYAAAQNAAANEMRIQRARAEKAEKERDEAQAQYWRLHEAAKAADGADEVATIAQKLRAKAEERAAQAEAKLAEVTAERDLARSCDGYTAFDRVRVERDRLAAALREIAEAMPYDYHECVRLASSVLADLGKGAGA